MPFPQDVARIRLDNALLLFDEFVRATVRHADAATLRGLERRFAERLQIQPSYWSQIKSRSRQIGERLARQFEQLCRKPVGWMDLPHGPGADAAAAPTPAAAAGNAGSPVPQEPAAEAPKADGLPQDDDERFIVGLVLTYYRRHPQRARARLLDLLGEVLVPAPDSSSATRPASPRTGSHAATRAPSPAPSPAEDKALWRQAQAGVAPLKPRR